MDGLYIMENPITIHDLGGKPLFLETPISRGIFFQQICHIHAKLWVGFFLIFFVSQKIRVIIWAGK